jgi:hypothetical protein
MAFQYEPPTVSASPFTMAIPDEVPNRGGLEQRVFNERGELEEENLGEFIKKI